jgi:DNA-directed RNA polymerase specialized sigma24 family protein
MASDLDKPVFERLFLLLEPGAQSTDAGFRRCRHKLVKFFAWRQCADPDDLADETISRLLKNIGRGLQISSNNPYSYVYAIAGNVFREYTRSRGKLVSLGTLEEVREPTVPDAIDESYAYCLGQLEPAQRELLREYYLENNQPEDVAQKHKLSLNALRLQIHRIKLSLRRCKDNYKKQTGETEI